MHSYSDAIIIAQEKMRTGEMTAAQANVYIVQLIGFKVITGPIPKDVRTALNNAVKSGELGHIKKDGLKPEVYHHKNGRANALDARDRVFRDKLQSLKGIYA